MVCLFANGQFGATGNKPIKKGREMKKCLNCDLVDLDDSMINHGNIILIQIRCRKLDLEVLRRRSYDFR